MALIKQLNDSHTDIHVLNRAQLIDDAFTLARAGKLDYSIPLHLTKYLTKENNTIPWYPAMNGLSFVLERMPRSDKGYTDLKVNQSQPSMIQRPFSISLLRYYKDHYSTDNLGNIWEFR